MEEKDEFDDEEISLDFKKVKGVFSKIKKDVSEDKKEEKVAKAPMDEKKHAEEKVKKEPEAREKHEKEEDEVRFDAKKLSGFFVKNQKVLIPIVIILVAVFLSAYVRVQTASLPITDSWAEDAVYDYFRSQIKIGIDKEYPNLPSQNKDLLVEKEFELFLKENKELVEQQIEQTSAYFKAEMQDDSGQTYLIGLDPYFWYRHVENILERGHPGDIIKDGVPYDTYMFAPIGRPVPKDMFHVYFEAYLYKFLYFFNKDLTPIKVIFYVPIILCALAVIPAFFIARRIGGDIGGLVAAVILAVHPAILSRTVGGFADTDAYSILWPLVITWFFLIALETQSRNKRIVFSSLAGFFVGIFAFSWGGWWYIFDFILASAAIYLIYCIILERDKLKKGTEIFKQPVIKNTAIILLIFIISSGLFVSLFVNFNSFKKAPLAPLGFMELKEIGVKTIWPNVYTTVAEQNPASLNSVISQIGFGGKSNGKFLLCIAAIGILLTLFRKDVRGKVNTKYAILLSLWLIATLYASTKGVRYEQLVIPAFCISIGVAIGIAYEFVINWVSKELNIHKFVVGSVLILLITVVFLVGPVRVGVSLGKNSVADMNDAWYNSLDKINKEAAPDAIINSWWDFGHWFKAIGNRPVTFDGTSQNSPQAHWVGLALMTDDEKMAIGILRMLDCNANEAFNELNNVMNHPVKSIGLLKEIIVVDEAGARRILQKNRLSEDKIKEVLAHTHCNPPEDYFITSDDMVQKSGVWAHFGSWDFERAMIYNTLQKPEYAEDMQKSVEFMQKEFNYSESKARDTYYKLQSFEKGGDDVNNWVAPWPGYASAVNSCKTTGNYVVCTIPQGGQAMINLTTMNVEIPTDNGVMHPNSIAYATEEGFFEKKFEEKTIGYSIILIPSGKGYKNVLSAPELAGSMFTRLYYFKGHGLKQFKLFTHEKSPVGGAEIYIWKVDWQGQEKNYVKEFFPKEETAVNRTETNSTG